MKLGETGMTFMWAWRLTRSQKARYWRRSFLKWEKALHFREIVRNFCGGRWEVRGDESIMSSYIVDALIRCLILNM